MSAEKINIEKFYYERRSQKRNTVGFQHYHNLFEIYYLEKGSCRYFIDEETYDIQEGDVVLIPEGIIHKTMYDYNDSERRLIYCNSKYVPASVIPFLSSAPYVYRNKKVSETIRTILNSLEDEYLFHDSFSDDAIMHYMHLFFFLLARNATDTESPNISGSDYTAKTIAYIKKHFSSDIHLAELASKCAVSPEHLCRVFKRDTGLGISEYLSIIRLQKAQELLTSSKALTIAEVAYSCGFNDSNYFSLKFKQMYGTSPMNFRKRKKIEG